MEKTQPFATDVLIAGSGPTGSALALALASHGVKTHIVSRFNWLADTPRAHITNQRTMEVFRDLGIEEECYRYATPWNQMGDSLITTSLAGEELLRIRAWGTGDERRSDYLEGSPCELLDLPQPIIEPILFKNAAARGATFSFNTEYLDHTQDADGVTVSLQDRLTQREYAVRAKYLIGADGAKSKVLDDAGLTVEGHFARAATAYVIFNADLSRYVAHRPSILHWIVSPDAAFGEIGLGLLRAVKPWNTWIAGWGFDMAKGEPDLGEDVLKKQIRVLVGDPALEPEIVHSTIWYVNQAYAPQYSKGRVFCGGDAVHRHPPSSGLGLNTCVQDAFNLGWKLAYVLKGHADRRLLETYSAERAPVGRQVVMRANQSRLDYGPLKAVFRVEGAANPVASGIERFKDPGPDGVKARIAAVAALDLKNHEFNGQGVELNQRYESAAVIQDPELGEEVWKRDREVYLQATTRPGAKIPHAWLVDRHGRRRSTLDVTGKGLFSLVTGISGTAWVEAARRLALPYLRSVTTGLGDAQDPYCEWIRRREIDEAGALLVRPDSYIAWRYSKPIHDVEVATALLKSAISRVLGSQETA